MKKLAAALTALTASALLFGAIPASAADIVNEDFENGLKYGLEESFSIAEEGGNHSLLMDGGSGSWLSAGISLDQYKFSDFTLTCDLKLLAFRANDAAFNIYFRGSEATDETPGYRFLLGYQDSAAGAETFNVQFEKDEGGKRSWPNPAVNVQDKIKTATWSKLAIVAQGDKFELYMGPNENSMELVCSAQDSTHKSGGFRFAVWGATVQIDNLSIVSQVNRPGEGGDDTPDTTTTPNTPNTSPKPTTTRNTPNTSPKPTTTRNTPNTAPTGNNGDDTPSEGKTTVDSNITTADETSAGETTATDGGEVTTGQTSGRSTTEKTTRPSSIPADGDVEKPGGGLSTGAIVAIVVVVVVLAAGAAVTLVILKKKGILFNK